jgi:hypothetical protein
MTTGFDAGRPLCPITTVSPAAAAVLPPGFVGRSLPPWLAARLPDADHLVIVGKGNHRGDWTRYLIDLARERYRSTLIIDMGWPSEDRQYADVAPFAASRYVGRVLAAWLRKAEQQ